MRIGTWAAAALLALSLAACGKKNEAASSSTGNAVEVQAAADASNVTSIPGYTPGTPAAGNTAGAAAP